MIRKQVSTKRPLSLYLVICFFVLSAFGCGGGGGSSSDSGGGSTSPEISLSTSQLPFGNVVANTQGLRSADRSVQVTNLGTAILNVGQIAQGNPLALPFEIFENNCSGLSLAPNASCSVIVRFKPTVLASSVYTDSFDIPSNDADEPSLTVNVSGNGQGLNVTINKVDTSVPNVRLIVSVTDGDNNPLTTLDAGNFVVSEEGASKLFNLSGTKVNTPVSVALNLDYSASITPFQNDVEESAKGFLANLTTPGDEASVIKFAKEVIEAIGFTQTDAGGLALLNTAIDAAYTDPTNATKLYDAVYGSIDSLDLLANDRLAAIVVSDGVDFDRLTGTFASTQDLDDVIANANAKKVFVYSIGLGADINAEVMQRMAVETKGQYFESPDSADLAAIYNQISLILTNQYEITFSTSRAVGTLNSLNVVVTSGGLDGEDTESVTY